MAQITILPDDLNPDIEIPASLEVQYTTLLDDIGMERDYVLLVGSREDLQQWLDDTHGDVWAIED